MNIFRIFSMILLKRYKKRSILLILILMSFVYLLSSFMNKIEKRNPSIKEYFPFVKFEPTVPKTKPSIDMVNDYYPFVDFKFVLPDISPKFNATPNVFMIVFVVSGAKGIQFRERCEAIRETWGNRSNCEQRKALENKKLKDLRWLLVFVLGKAGPETNDDELNMAEARQHNDMLIGNIRDNYINLIIKVFMAQLWASRFDVQYTLKADDDVYVRIPRVLEYLANTEFPRPFYGGCPLGPMMVDRRVTGKWAVSWKYYNETNFPKFNRGPFYMLSSDLLIRLFNYVLRRKPFHTEDVYVALAMRDFGINVTDIHSFHLTDTLRDDMARQTFKDCEMLGWSAMGHYLDAPSLKKLHLHFESLVCRNITLDIDYHHCP